MIVPKSCLPPRMLIFSTHVLWLQLSFEKVSWNMWIPMTLRFYPFCLNSARGLSKNVVSKACLVFCSLQTKQNFRLRRLMRQPSISTRKFFKMYVSSAVWGCMSAKKPSLLKRPMKANTNDLSKEDQEHNLCCYPYCWEKYIFPSCQNRRKIRYK